MKFHAGLVLLVAIAVSGCQNTTGGVSAVTVGDTCEGVTVVVDFGLLAEPPAPSCVEVPESGAVAGTVLQTAGYTTEGTDTYGDLVVCRVNDLPSPTDAFEVPGEDPHLETCAEMPPVFAYWALWQKKAPGDAWDYAQEGVGSLQLTPGMSIGLVFSTGGETPTPDSRSD